MYEQDYIMRQIRDLVRFLAKILLNKDTVIYELPDMGKYTDTDYLYKELLFLLNQGKINEAENLLFENLDTGNERYIELALDFYERLNNFSDDYLEKNNFSREEIEEGLEESAREFGWDMLWRFLIFNIKLFIKSNHGKAYEYYLIIRSNYTIKAEAKMDKESSLDYAVEIIKVYGLEP